MNAVRQRPGSAVQVVRDIEYGRGLVGRSRPDGAASRALCLDLYLPDPDHDAAGTPRPAVVFAFGGAFHRGNRVDDAFDGNTAVATYARRCAERGWVAASVDYRLAPEDPEPGDTPAIGSPERIPLSRVAHVRRLLGLPPADAAQIARTMEAACDDVAMAVRYLRLHAAGWQVDPARIALGGFSAGARSALNVALAEDADVAAVVSLSGYADPDDIVRHSARGARPVPVLLIAGEHDLDYVREGMPAMRAAFVQAGWPCEVAQVEDATHFYPADAPVRRDDGSRSIVEAVAFDFLTRHLVSRGHTT